MKINMKTKRIKKEKNLKSLLTKDLSHSTMSTAQHSTAEALTRLFFRKRKIPAESGFPKKIGTPRNSRNYYKNLYYVALQKIGTPRNSRNSYKNLYTIALRKIGTPRIFSQAKKTPEKLQGRFASLLLSAGLSLLLACSSGGGGGGGGGGGSPAPTCTALAASVACDSLSGAGTSSDPYVITSYNELKAMGASAACRANHYQLSRDIDASASHSECTSEGCVAYDPDTASGSAGHPDHADTCTGWVPVGDSIANAFTGGLDGDGKKISNLYGKNNNPTGLFGVTNGATIENLALENIYIYSASTVTGAGYAGGIVGNMSGGSLTKSYASGLARGNFRVGGLVGSLAGSGMLSNSYSTVAVTGNDSVGGLVGRTSSATISNSYAIGTVMGVGSVGGLVGQSDGTISNSYAIGTVTGTGSTGVGGLAGRTGGNISNTYAAGMVTGSGGPRGGLLGTFAPGGSFSGKNYFVDSDGGTDGVGFAGTCASTICTRAMGANDAARRTWLQDTLDESDDSGLDWETSIWGNFTGSGVGYPCLKGMPAGAPACP